MIVSPDLTSQARELEFRDIFKVSDNHKFTLFTHGQLGDVLTTPRFFPDLSGGSPPQLIIAPQLQVSDLFTDLSTHRVDWGLTWYTRIGS